VIDKNRPFESRNGRFYLTRENLLGEDLILPPAAQRSLSYIQVLSIVSFVSIFSEIGKVSDSFYRLDPLFFAVSPRMATKF